MAYVPSIVVKDILTQPDQEGRRAKLISILLEYDLEIKHTMLVKGQGLDKLLSHSSIDFIKINFLDTSTGIGIKNNEKEICSNYMASPWYTNIIYIFHVFHFRCILILERISRNLS